MKKNKKYISPNEKILRDNDRVAIMVMAVCLIGIIVTLIILN